MRRGGRPEEPGVAPIPWRCPGHVPACLLPDLGLSWAAGTKPSQDGGRTSGALSLESPPPPCRLSPPEGRRPRGRGGGRLPPSARVASFRKAGAGSSGWWVERAQGLGGHWGSGCPHDPCTPDSEAQTALRGERSGSLAPRPGVFTRPAHGSGRRLRSGVAPGPVGRHTVYSLDVCRLSKPEPGARAAPASRGSDVAHSLQRSGWAERGVP